MAAQSVLRPIAAWAEPTTASAPTPIPNGIMIPGPNGPQLFHFFLPGPSDNLNASLTSPGGELSSVFDFDGLLGVANVKGQGTATGGDDDDDSEGKTLFYDADCRFMSGRYIDRGGRQRHATFGFV